MSEDPRAIEGRLFEPPPGPEEPFTPGPWETDNIGVWTMYEHAMGGPICEIVDDYPRGFNRPKQNMQLVSAAPDMWWALRRLLAACQSAEIDGELPPDVDGSLLGAAQRALLKAEGKKV